MKNNSILEHKHRLSKNLYIGKIVCAFTICVLNKQKLFLSKEIFDVATNVLLESLKKNNSEAHIYLFMPDHCHLLIEGKTEKSNLWRCIAYFKQKCGYWLAKQNYKEKWQKDFYDHILRKDEDVIKQVKYILGNPVRKGLVNNWKNYPFKGSTIYDFNKWE